MSELRECPFCADGAINIGDKKYPIKWFAIYEVNAQRNHDQTVKRLAERGGVSWQEAACIIQGRNWSEGRNIEKAQAIRIVESEYAAWNTRPTDDRVSKLVEAALEHLAESELARINPHMPHIVKRACTAQGKLREAIALFGHFEGAL